MSKLTIEEREKITKKFTDVFSIKVTPNNEEAREQAFILELFWKNTTLADMSNFWLNIIDQQREQAFKEGIQYAFDEISLLGQTKARNLDDYEMVVGVGEIEYLAKTIGRNLQPNPNDK